MTVYWANYGTALEDKQLPMAEEDHEIELRQVAFIIIWIL